MTITKKAYQSFKLAMLSLLLMFIFSAYPLTVHADSAAGAIIDSLGRGSTAGTSTIQKGISYTRTGYLCYLLTKDGNAIPGMAAKAFATPGCVLHDGTLSIAKSRKGNYTADSFVGEAPWGCPPFGNSDSYGNVTTNEPTIKAWLATKDATGNSNAVNFVHQTWNNSSYDEKFMDDEYVLVIETMVNFQYSVPDGSAGSSSTDAGSTSGGMTQEEAIAYINSLPDDDLVQAARNSGNSTVQDYYLKPYDYFTTAMQKYENGEITQIYTMDGIGKITYEQADDRVVAVIDKMRIAVRSEMRDRYRRGLTFSLGSTSSGGRQYFGTPILGTLPNVLDYRTTYIPECTSNWFASYTNKAAAFAEYIAAGKAGERAGFRPWTGSTTEKLTDGQVKEYGVGLMVISAHDNVTTDYTHTWDAENCGSNPGKAPEYIPTQEVIDSSLTDPSLQCTYTIIKAYRTLNTSSYINDGVYTREDTIGKILIEDEPTYTVVDWFTTSTPTATVGLADATRWNESKSHASIMEQGNSSLASPITLPSAQKYLYVLLECTHTSSPPTDANYTLLE